MNLEIRSWFDQGKIVEALCGLGNYFTPGVTYWDVHDYNLVIRELMSWVGEKHSMMASQAFEDAVRHLLSQGMLENALMLVHSYYVVCSFHEKTFDIREDEIARSLTRAIFEAKDLLPSNEELRSSVIVAARDMPALRNMLDLSSLPPPEF